MSQPELNNQIVNDLDFSQPYTTPSNMISLTTNTLGTCQGVEKYYQHFYYHSSIGKLYYMEIVLNHTFRTQFTNALIIRISAKTTW